MATYNITLTDLEDRGVAAALAEYNNDNPDTVNEDGTVTPNPNKIVDGQSYIQFVMSRASDSYVNQYKVG